MRPRTSGRPTVTACQLSYPGPDLLSLCRCSALWFGKNGKQVRTMPVESARTGQSLVERFREIGSGDNDDAFDLLETIELDEELIQGLLHVVLAWSASAMTPKENSAHPGTPLLLGVSRSSSPCTSTGSEVFKA